MDFNRKNIYRLIAGTLGHDIKKFNPKADLVKAYSMDSLSVLDIGLVIEDYTNHEVIIPDNILSTLKTAELYADYILENTDAV